MADSLTTRILAFDFDQCVCDGEGFFELFTQLLDIYQFCHINKHTDIVLPAGFVEAVEKAYTTLALEAAAASKNKELFLFRPGMENVFRTAQLMKSQGRIQYVMFYSNNSCPEFLSFSELVIRLANLNMFSVKKPVIELVFTANTASRMKVERAPAGQPNSREKTVRGILQCLEDLDLPFSDKPEILFFDDLKHNGLGTTLKMVPEYKTLHTGQQIYDVFFGCLEKAGLFIGGELRPEWQKLGISNSLMKNPASVFKDWLLSDKDLPTAPINAGPVYEKEIKVSEMMSSEIYTFCGVQAINKKKSRKRRGKYDH
jgi:hypothetical protein